jgi:hypothetical protein
MSSCCDASYVRYLKIGNEAIGEEDERRARITTVFFVDPELKTIPPFAFAGCTKLASIVLPAGLTTIGESAFRNCSALSSIVLPAGLTMIGVSAFAYCRSLASVSLPEGLVTIGDLAFFACPKLTSISLPDSVDTDNFSPETFLACVLLSKLSSAKRMDVEDFLRWRHHSLRERYAVLASLLRLRTELYERPKKKKRAAVVEEAEVEQQIGTQPELQRTLEFDVVTLDGAGGEDGGQGDGGRLQGVLAFESIQSEDVWRYMLEFL